MALTSRVRRVSDELVPDDSLLPKPPERRRRYAGRLRVPDRVALAGIVYALRKGVAWRDVPASVVGCSGVTAWRRLRDWTEAGVWSQLHAALLTELRKTGLLDMGDTAIDGSHIRVRKGGSSRPLAR
jgi:transposase